MSGYVLITPLKDEEANLVRLKETVFNQTLRPLLWVIVDSGSLDDTFQVAERLFAGHEWIWVIRQTKYLEKGYGHLNFAQAINDGYAWAKHYCEERDLEYSFVGKTDATPVLSHNYFNALLAAMLDNPRLAVTCGTQIICQKDKMQEDRPIKNLPMASFNDIRLYRKDFLESIGGYPITYSPDTVMLIKARKSGWMIEIVGETSFLKPRQGGTKIGIFRGYALKGTAMYVLGYGMTLVLLNALWFSIRRSPHYQFLPILWGYLSSAVKKQPRISDQEILDYFARERPKEILKLLFKGKKRDSSSVFGSSIEI